MNLGTHGLKNAAHCGNVDCASEVVISHPFVDLSPSFNEVRMVSDDLPTFDLSDVRERVARENPQLAEETLDEGEIGYREYLRAAKINPAITISPTLLVDEFWHSHILHTEQYFRDCSQYFGYYFHHRPTS